MVQRVIKKAMLSQTMPGVILLSFGFGAVISDIVVNKYGDMLFGNDILTAPFGGREAFGMLGSLFSIMVGISAIVAFLTLARFLYADVITPNSAFRDFVPEGRAWHYLIGCGLNETQANVLLMIAKGASSHQISSDLGFSRGAINSARRVGYIRLGIHDRLGLVTLLSQVNDL